MTKEELAKKKGLKVTTNALTPAEKLVTSIEPPKSDPEPSPKVEVKPEPKTERKAEKKPVGKPKKRKPGDRKMSFWLDEDLVPLVFKNLSYGDAAGEYLNTILRKYFDEHSR